MTFGVTVYLCQFISYEVNTPLINHLLYVILIMYVVILSTAHIAEDNSNPLPISGFVFVLLSILLDKTPPPPILLTAFNVLFE